MNGKTEINQLKNKLNYFNMTNKDKTPSEIIQELDFDIYNLENFIENLHSQILVKKLKLEQLKNRKKSILNYLNENE